MNLHDDISKENKQDHSDYLTIDQSVNYLSNVSGYNVTDEHIYKIYIKGLIELFIEIRCYTHVINFSTIDIKYKIENKNILLVKGIYGLHLTSASEQAILNKFNSIKKDQKRICITGQGIIIEDINNFRLYQLLEYNQPKNNDTPIFNFQPQSDSSVNKSDNLNHQIFTVNNINIDKSKIYKPQAWRQAGYLPLYHDILILKTSIHDEFVVSCIKDLIDEINSNDSLKTGSTYLKNKQHQLANEQPFTINKKHSLADKKINTRSESKNYFILENKNWFIKFQGGPEKVIRACVPISVLIIFLRYRDTSILPDAIYSTVCALPVDDESANGISFYGHGENSEHEDNPDKLESNSRYVLQKNSSRHLRKKDKMKLEDDLKELLLRIDKNKKNIEKHENLYSEFNEIKQSIERSYLGVEIYDDGTISIDEGYVKYHYRSKEYVSNNIKRAIELIKKHDLLDLTEHLTNCISNKNCIYTPNIDIEWDIIDD